MRDDFSGIRADRDGYFDDEAPARSHHGKPAREKNLALQIALGIWLGGVALGITGLLANLLLGGLLSGAVKIGLH
jgi:hypothetical protein